MKENMQGTWITCSMCGYTFDPSNHPACGSCPLQRGCLAVCCPNCGFETVDVNRSRLARWFAGILTKKTMEKSRQA